VDKVLFYWKDFEMAEENKKRSKFAAVGGFFKGGWNGLKDFGGSVRDIAYNGVKQVKAINYKDMDSDNWGDLMYNFLSGENNVMLGQAIGYTLVGLVKKIVNTIGSAVGAGYNKLKDSRSNKHPEISNATSEEPGFANAKFEEPRLVKSTLGEKRIAGTFAKASKDSRNEKSSISLTNTSKLKVSSLNPVSAR